MVVPTVHKGIQFQPLRMNNDAIGALGADTALQLNSAITTGLTQSFLVKQVDLRYNVISMNAGDNVIIGLAVGTADVTMLASAIRDVTLDPDAPGERAEPATSNLIWWETLRSHSVSDTLGAGAGNTSPINETISIGGGRGLPMKKDHGIQVFAYNPGSGAITLGSAVAGLIVLKGVWLND